MRAHPLLALALLLSASLLPSAQSAGAPAVDGAGGGKTLRYAFLVAETTFDPAQVSDLYSRTVIAGILDAPLEFEHLARPTRMRPNTVAEMPQVSDDFRTFTL